MRVSREAVPAHRRNTIAGGPRLGSTGKLRRPEKASDPLTASARGRHQRWNAHQPSYVFSARELLNHATVDSTLRPPLGGANAKQIGKRLRRVADQQIGSYEVLWAERDNGGSIWTIEVAAGG